MSDAPAAIPDMEALRSCWHPVAFATDLTAKKPLGVTLLDEPVAIWRGAEEGQLHAVKDLCIHRGTALSLGWTDGDQIVCPYHGWRYRANGVCAAIPQLEDASKVPAKARIDAYSCQERYGLIWVALDEPRYDLPAIPELEDESWMVIPAGPYAWAADSSRQLENFTDFGHFPWVHPGLLGDPERPVVPSYTVETEGHVLHYNIVRPEAPNSDEFPIFANEVEEAPERRSRYELHLPYTIVLRVGWGGEKGMLYFFASQPVSDDRCVGFLVMGRNYDFDQPIEVLQEFEDTIFNQDKVIVESQRPEQVPFDLADELHLKFDAVAVSYRRAMREQGLATSSD